MTTPTPNPAPLSWSQRWCAEHDAGILWAARAGAWDPGHCAMCAAAHWAAKAGATWIEPHPDRAGRRINRGGWAAWDESHPHGMRFESPIEAETWIYRAPASA